MNRPEPPTGWRRAAALAAAACALALAACAAPTDRAGEIDVRPRATAASATNSTRPEQCIPEGQSCQAPGAVCCPGTTCTGVGRPLCLYAY